ncbi:sensor histidine kinase, partial [Streptococcus pyogenes]
MQIKHIRFLRFVLVVINFLAVLYNASLYLFASKYIVSKGFSYSLLEKLTAIPTKPTVIFWSSIISFTLLLLVMQIRNCLNEESEIKIKGFLVLEIFLLIT